MDATVNYDEPSDTYSLGFTQDGAFVPFVNLPGSTVRSHIERTNETDRKQFPQKD